MARLKKTVFVCGRYGSGKTTVALNLAFMLSESGNQVNLVDLDVRNPYFRSSDLKDRIQYDSIRLYCPKPGDVTIADEELLPSVIAEIKDDTTYVIVDVGDDAEGIEAMNRLSKSLDAAACDVFYVVNFNKSATATAEQAGEELQTFCAEIGFACTGIINNTQAGGQTDQAMMDESVKLSERLCASLELPLIYHCYNKSLDLTVPEKAMPIEIYVTPSWLQ